MAQKSDIPFASEFSPSIIDLGELLEMAVQHPGDTKALESSIRAEWFESRSTTESNKNTLAMNVRLGMQKYLLLDSHGFLTEVGESLNSAPTESDRSEILGRHILLHLNGSVFVETIRDMQRAGERITLSELRSALEIRGIHTSNANKSMSVMRLWLARAGVFSDGQYTVDVTRYEQLLGLATKELERLADLSGPQRAFAMALASQVDVMPTSALHVRRLAEEAFGGQYDEKQFAKTILYPLRDAGLINLDRMGGRAKSFMVEPTGTMVTDVIDPLLQQYALKVSPGVLEMIRRPLPEIVAELTASDRHIKGLALEALAFRLMWLIGLRHQGTRASGIHTGGAEVDLVFDSLLLAYSRWQIQCKNTGRVALDDVAKEVGVAQFLMSNVIVVVSTGSFSQAARDYARHIMKASNLAIVLIDDNDIEQVLIERTAMLDILEREARIAFELKPLSLNEG